MKTTDRLLAAAAEIWEGNRQVIEIIKPVLETFPGKTALFATILGLYE